MILSCQLPLFHTQQVVFQQIDIIQLVQTLKRKAIYPKQTSYEEEKNARLNISIINFNFFFPNLYIAILKAKKFHTM